MSDRLRVTFVTRKWPPAMGGMETYSKALTDALRKDVDLRVIALPGNRDGSVPGTLALLRFGALTAVRLLMARRPDPITHIGDMASWPLGLCARLRRPGAQRVLSAHGTDVSYPLRGGVLGRLYGAYLRLGARLLGPTTVIANSAATAEEARVHGFRNTVVVPLAAYVRTQTIGYDGSRRMLFSGRLIPSKGLTWFAAEVLPQLPDDIGLDVAGTVWDEGERRALDDPRVRHVGHLDQQTLWQAYAKALCVVVPNVDRPNGGFEGFGLVAVEAAAAGGLVLVSNHSGLKDAAIHGETGFHLPPGDAAAWGAKIREIAEWDSARRSAFTQNARRVCETRFSWQRVADDTLRQYRASGSAPRSLRAGD
ncbi:MAG: glycosyltransferase family 4 protein [Pseudomonadota bacterium]